MPLTGRDFIRAVADALSIPPHATKLVIEAEVGKVVRVYLKGYAPGEALPTICQAVKDVAVSDAGEVTVTDAERYSPPTPTQVAAAVAFVERLGGPEEYARLVGRPT